MPEKCVVCQEPDITARCAQCGAARAPGGYVVERLVAQSAHSRLYLAAGPDGRRVALKELVFSLVPGARELDAFQREVALLEGLDVPGVPRFIASFQEGRGVGTRLYLAQDFIDGTSLLERLRDGVLDEQAAIAVARQVLEILDRLHGRVPSVLHRDVKPANLVETEDGRIVLVDFGAARVLQAEVTFGSTLVGTFGYMAPEQLAGSVDASTDLYALGATLVHLLTGKAPSELVDGAGALALEIDGRVPASKRFRAWLSKLVAPRRAMRFRSAKEALAGLDEVTAPAPGFDVASNQSLYAVLGLFLSAALGGILLLEFYDTPSSNVRTLPPAKATKSFEPAVPALVKRARESVREAAQREALPPVEIVSLERVQAPGARAAFWLEAPLELAVPEPDRDPYSLARYRAKAEAAKPCREAPAEYVGRVKVTLPAEIRSGAKLNLVMSKTSYGYRSSYSDSFCDDVLIRLLSKEGEEMRRIGDARSREWIILRHVPRYVLQLGRGADLVEVEFDLEEKQIVLPG